MPFSGVIAEFPSYSFVRHALLVLMWNSRHVCLEKGGMHTASSYNVCAAAVCTCVDFMSDNFENRIQNCV